MSNKITARFQLLAALLALGIGTISSGMATSSETKGRLNVDLSLSKPANGKFFVTGERAVVGIVLKDSSGNAVNKGDIDTLGLYMYGPQDPAKTVSAVKLLNATTDRSRPVHHFIDLLASRDAQFSENFVSYPLRAITDEEPGTYTASLRIVLKGNPPADQAFFLKDFQIKTANVEKQMVEAENCASCHRGADNGRMYLHHIDPGRTAFGSPALDADPVRTCKSCHNNEGYAAYPSPENPNVRVSDPIMFRVHGVHMGIKLKNPRNTDHDKGLFAHYTHVIFPADVKDCTTCHVDDRWKTKPSRAACGACHDNVWFGPVADMPKGMERHGTPLTADSRCQTCHTPDPSDDKNAVPISASHKISQPMNEVVVSLTPAKNGKYYVAGEKPVVTMVIKDNAGKPLADHGKVAEDTFRVASLFVYGPTRNSKPVLTSIAKDGVSRLRAAVSNTKPAAGSPERGWTFKEGDTFKIAVNNGPVTDLKAPAGFQTPAQVRAWLTANLKGATVSASATAVTITSELVGPDSKITIYNSPVTETMGWKAGGRPLARGGRTAGATVEPLVVVGRASYQGNDLRRVANPRAYVDPNVTRNAGNITYQLDDVKDLVAGTYMIYVWVQPAGKAVATDKATDPNFSNPAIGYMTFQVGRAEADKEVATNCKSCHRETVWHLDAGPQHPEPFDPGYCKACHDYARYNTGNGFEALGGNSQNGWSGFGAVPLSRRVHGVHYGKYLNFPEEIYAGNPNQFSEAIFPQDVRNCTKCHTPETTGTWKTEPSRLACMSCHDSQSANAHAIQQTLNRTPGEEWNEARVETCSVCHGAGRQFSIEKSHNISTPYKPPYRRAGGE